MARIESELPPIPVAAPHEKLPNDELAREFFRARMQYDGPVGQAARPVLKWPDGASILLDIPVGLLRAQQSKGDHPELLYIGRQTYVTRKALDAWIAAKQSAPPRRTRKVREVA